MPVFLSDIEVWAEAFQREKLSVFYRRSQTRPGRFLDPAKLDSLRTRVLRVSDLFARMGGLTVRPAGLARLERGRFRRGGVTPVIAAASSGPVIEFFGCGRPLIVLNDVPMRGWTVDELVGLEQLTAVEVYRPAEVPLQYAFTGGCGAIVLWTR